MPWLVFDPRPCSRPRETDHRSRNWSPESAPALLHRAVIPGQFIQQMIRVASNCSRVQHPIPERKCALPNDLPIWIQRCPFEVILKAITVVPTSEGKNCAMTQRGEEMRTDEPKHANNNNLALCIYGGQSNVVASKFNASIRSICRSASGKSSQAVNVLRFDSLRRTTIRSPGVEGTAVS